VDIIVATPLRLLALIHSGDVDLSTIEIVVLDEADKLFELEAPGKELFYTNMRACCFLHGYAVSYADAYVFPRNNFLPTSFSVMSHHVT
jgi:DEAD/DEAH box helicase